MRIHRAPELLGTGGHGPVHASPRRHRRALRRRDGRRPLSHVQRGHLRTGEPRHLSSDHDPLFEAHRWTANLRILEIDEIKTVPNVPLSHPFVERLIGTMRREFLDQALFWNARDLERKLAEFQVYYNAARGHASLEGHTPLTFASGHTAVPADLNHVRWVSHCRDLVQLPVAA
jgi:transposase InsO family protein